MDKSSKNASHHQQALHGDSLEAIIYVGFIENVQFPVFKEAVDGNDACK